jgi:plastocyanin
MLSLSLLCAAACSGESRPSTDTTAAVPTPAPPGSTAVTGGAGAKAATGKTWDVKMIGDGQTYQFEPASLTIKVGDAVRWTVISGTPHNVSFWSDSIPSGAESQLGANMENTMSPLTGPLLNAVSDTYTISFAGVPPGSYKYYCTPHLALGMKGSLTIQ